MGEMNDVPTYPNDELNAMPAGGGGGVGGLPAKAATKQAESISILKRKYGYIIQLGNHANRSKVLT